MSAIIDIHAREILDSRGNPTVEADVVLRNPALSAAQLFRPVLLPVCMKLSNCVTATKTLYG